MRNDDIIYDYWWASLERSYSMPLFRIAVEAGGTRKLFEMSESSLAGIKGISREYAGEIVKSRKEMDIYERYQNCVDEGIKFVPYYSKEYPERLRRIPGHPFAIFVKGRLPEDERKSVAIIGSRECSEYGRFMAEKLGKGLAGYGVQVVSGMACGIDGLSQMACLNAGGESFAVLGSGVDVCYPPANRKLYERLIQLGGVISEYGLHTPPKGCLFPARNRIISALSDLVVVVEARVRSGTTITVDMALEQGRDVAVVPGRVCDPLSQGCVSLLKQGAMPVGSAEDIMEILDAGFLSISEEGGNGKEKKESEIDRTFDRASAKHGKVEGDKSKKGEEKEKINGLTPEGKLLYRTLDVYAKSMDRLLNETALLPDIFMEEILRLRMLGLASEVGKDYYIKVL